MLKAYDRKTGKEVKVGEIIYDFRGEKAILKSLDRAEEIGRSGKISVQEYGYTNWHTYYDRVYNLRVIEEKKWKLEI